jgi:hypothetical protein
MKIRHWVALGAAVPIVVAGVAIAQMNDDTAFAGGLWDQLAGQRLVGPELIGAVPYLRMGEAHGATLVTLVSTATVNGVTGRAIVKRSYGDGATREGIIAAPAENLANVTVMFQREAGYAPEHGDWFWAMFTPDGAVAEMGGMAVAGRVEMCTACHAAAPGGDYTFLY